jgi:hypothetical protein
MAGVIRRSTEATRVLPLRPFAFPIAFALARLSFAFTFALAFAFRISLFAFGEE